MPDRRAGRRQSPDMRPGYLRRRSVSLLFLLHRPVLPDCGTYPRFLPRSWDSGGRLWGNPPACCRCARLSGKRPHWKPAWCCLTRKSSASPYHFLHGWSASLTEYRSNHWRVNLVKRNTRKQEVVSKSVEHYEGLVHCLEMPLENFVIRQGNKVHVTGNCRLDRYVNEHPELQGTLGTDKLPFAKYGWEVHPFLKPVEIEGIFFVHYLANPMSGKPYGGSAMNILKTVGRSFVVGHKQCLDIAIRPTIDGKQQLGIVNGACYDHFESYKGFTGNNHFRGLTVLHECSDGFAVPMFVSLDYMKEKYYE